MKWHDWPKHIFLPICFHAKLIWSFSVKRCRHGRTPKIGERKGPHWGGSMTCRPKNKPPLSMCHHVKFGSSASKDVCRIGRKLPKLRSAGAPPLAVGAWLTPRNTPLPTCVILLNLVILRQTVWALLSTSSRAPPFKVIGTDTDRSAACDYLLTFRSNHEPISYRFFRINGDFHRKSQIFSHPVYTVPSPKRFRLELGNGIVESKN